MALEASSASQLLNEPSDASPERVGQPGHGHSFSGLYSQHFHGGRRERLFLASAAFFVAFAATRAIAHAIRAGLGPFRDVTAGGTHLHHLVWGILLLLLVGYLWLAQAGSGMPGCSLWASRLTALLFGVGAALTLDEFALWLNLADVYWSRQGRESIDAIVLFGALLSVGFWGGPFLHAVARHFTARFGNRSAARA